jgi:hypothetical protein
MSILAYIIFLFKFIRASINKKNHVKAKNENNVDANGFYVAKHKNTTDNIVNRSGGERWIRPSVSFGGKRRASERYVISHYGFQHNAKR